MNIGTWFQNLFRRIKQFATNLLKKRGSGADRKDKPR